jgi:hypothetical protein
MRANAFPSIALGSVLALPLVHCGGDSGGPPNFNAFLGTWSCDSTTTVNLTKPAGTPSQKSTTTVTLEVKKSGANTITIGEMGDPTCAAELRISGTTGTLAGGFTCDQGDQSLKVQSAQVRASGDKLTGTRTAQITGTTNTGDAASGTATTSIDCTRLSGPPDADGGAGQGNGNTGAGANAGSGGDADSGASPGSGAKAGSGGNAGSGGSSGSGGAGSGGKASGGSAGSGGGANPPVDCTAEADCLTCCDDNFQAGVKRLDELLADCVCQECATECAASLCAATPSEPKMGDACDTCVSTSIDMGGACLMPTAVACTRDKICAPYATCIGSCP